MVFHPVEKACPPENTRLLEDSVTHVDNVVLVVCDM